MSLVRNFVEQGYAERIQRLDTAVCPLEQAEQTVSAWNRAGAMTVFIAGVFDLPTPNHRFGLAEARLMGGALTRGIDYTSLTAESPAELIKGTYEAAASDSVKLIVSVDTDENVKANKEYQKEKGNSPKPIFAWETRAYNLAAYTIPKSGDTHHRMVDFITTHGINACQTHDDCNSSDNAMMVWNLQPKLVVVNAASDATVKTVLDLKMKGLLPRTEIGLTNEHVERYVDRYLGRVSSTSIIRRAKGMDEGF